MQDELVALITDGENVWEVSVMRVTPSLPPFSGTGGDERATVGDWLSVGTEMIIWDGE